MIDRINERRRAAGEGGFTLIELLVVIIILGILAAVVVFAVGGIGDRGQGSACTIDTRTLRTASEAFYANDKIAPPDYGATPADWNGTGTAARTTIDENAAYVTGGFLSEISKYHDIRVYDTNATTGATGITPAIEVTVADASCGNPGSVTDGGNNK